MSRLSLMLLALIVGFRALAAEPSTRPATLPVQTDVLRLIAQLGDPAADRRDEAERQLRDMGRPALPLLADAAKMGNPEIAVRASRLIRLIEQPPGAAFVRPPMLNPGLGLDPIDFMRENLDLQMQRQRIAPDKRQAVLDELASLRRLRERQPDEDDASRDGRLKRYFERSDAFRERLKELKLDAGDFLPPPAKARLGIQCQSTRDDAGHSRLMVEAIVPDSRAAAMGLRPGDTIMRANGQEINDIAELRSILEQSKAPVRLEILRDDKPMVVTEPNRAGEAKP